MLRRTLIACLLAVAPTACKREPKPAAAGGPFDATAAVDARVAADAGVAVDATAAVDAAAGDMDFEEGACRARQHYARQALQELHGAQLEFFHEKPSPSEAHERYGSLEEIGFDGSPFAEHYELSITSADRDGFQARAQGKGLLANDSWGIDQNGKVEQLTDGCAPGKRPRR